ncbi:MAG: hypothetical protein JWR26_1320 [Pedosphaera sp.]|nr:hypothetical protein [Pedosphaera sp.]
MWTPLWRCVIFLLAATSIACLLTEFYGLCPMQQFTLAIFVPALAVLGIITAIDGIRGDRQMFRAVLIGTVAGLMATISYDVFRLPFVFAREWNLTSVVPAMNLFKVFPRFGAMILGQPLEQAHYSLPAQLVGWTYHFSNGITFGIMYVAMIGNIAKRNCTWAVVMAAGLELGMLFTPYPNVFGIPLSARFVVVTLMAHGIFGVAMGLTALRLSKRVAGERDKTLVPVG